jgi:aminopeptidase-like protein
VQNNENEIKELFETLFPICRSITGNGVRKTLSILKEITDFKIQEIPSGTECYDWIVPKEWNIVDAYIEDSTGKKIIDFQKNNLHVVNYSIPVDETISFEKLDKHLFSLPDLPNAIPYRTTYYKEDWGFCLTHEQLKNLNKNETYHVKIESTLKPGNLTYGEYIINGDSGKEFLISTYCCHPSLANDNLSGPILWTYLLKALKSKKLKHSYRFVIVPETIGAITYLSKNEKEMKKITGGFIITCTAGPGKFYDYKQTFHGNHLIDKVVTKMFEKKDIDFNLHPFDINGSDETQYSAPYFRIPMGTICRKKYYEYDYYHTSLDNLDFIDSKNLIETLNLHLDVIEEIENYSSEKIEFFSNTHKQISNKNNEFYISLNPYCEPMLSKRGLYPTIGGSIKQKAYDFEKEHLDRNYEIDPKANHSGSEIDAICWLMFYGDGNTDLDTISDKSGLSKSLLEKTAQKLLNYKLLQAKKGDGNQ